ncbi:MAG: 4Fe-4S binding protein [Clostridia bacterium]|nr:4Fe-4S binding protein [Clostridia bacterium]
MKKVKNFIQKYWPSKRKWMQLYFALLFNANLKGFVSGNIYTGSTKVACVPGLNCYSCPGAVGACPLGSLQGSFQAGKSTLFYVGGVLLLYGVLFGRMICGWLCPFGLIQELLHKIKTPKLKKSPVTRLLSYLKYVILVFLVVIVPVLYALRDTPLPAFCKYICPAGTLEGGISLLANKVNASYFSMLGPIFTWKFLLLVSITLGCIFVFRLFCRFICPLGAIYGLFNRISVFGIKLERQKCVDCNKCISHCQMDIRHVGDPECISCGECAAVCPTGAIRWKGPKVLVAPGAATAPAAEKPNRRKRLVTRIVAGLLMLAVLAGAIGYYWTQDSGPAGPADTQRGNQVGDVCYSYPLDVVTGDGVTGETVDPSATGRVTVLNFWGTWCTPCVNELPYFDRIATEYADRVTVIAAHGMATATAPAYIAQYYPDSAIVFANDYIPEGGTYENGYYTTLGGRGTYPYTLVLDETGVITHIFYSSVTYEMLKEAVDELV